jgi:L-aspartate oxidase
MNRAACELRISDILVVGSGVAGLAVAVHAGDRQVRILSKTRYAGGGSSVLAQGGVAVALGSDDSPARHAADTLAAGAELCDPEIVRLVTEEGPERMRELLRLGARVDRDADGVPALGREAAHSRRRVVHADGDATGPELVRAMSRAVSELPNVTIEEQVLALELIRSQDRVVGLLAVDSEGSPALHLASAVVLATGGIGQVFRHTTNPAEATGDGLAMAARAGARIAGLEFVQFHPTAMAVGGNPMPLLTEALRGEGATLVDENGLRFMTSVHGLAELAPRDVVARAIWRQRQEGHDTLLDATSLCHRFDDRFPTVLQLCLERGLDPRLEPIPVAPAAHYHMGGIVVDREGRSSLKGLSACGETAHTGLHGANRLASNSLLEALVLGARIGFRLADESLREPAPAERSGLLGKIRVADAPRLEQGGGEYAGRLREVMWNGVGLERTASGLRRALREINQLGREADPGLGEMRNLLTVARLVATAAWARTESRGAHYRGDVPWQDPHWRQHLYFDGMDMLQPQPIAAAG